jgi:hypothetical protein
LLIKFEIFFFVFIYCTEQMNLKNISYWHYFTTKIMSICPIWNFTLYDTQSLHFFFFENHPVVTRYIFVPVSSQDLDFQRQMSWSFLCSVSSVKLRGYCWTIETVDVCGIDDHHCLNFLFIKQKLRGMLNASWYDSNKSTRISSCTNFTAI